MSVCVKCGRGDHRVCTGFDGPMTEHPDSLPLCTCSECGGYKRGARGAER